MVLTMDDKRYLASWENENVIRFFTSNRNTPADVYPSEKHFLDKYLKPDMTVLDYGCATGGFCNILEIAYHVPPENYRGMDQSSKMIDAARLLYPRANFYTRISQIQEENQRFDLVFSFGVLHMTLDWEEILRRLYDLSSRYLIFDLRITQDGPSIEDISQSYQTLADDDDQDGVHTRVPYIVVNRADLERRFAEVFKGNPRILEYGYSHPVSETVTSPYNEVAMIVFCVIKEGT